jgi:hypothetical protein
MVRLGAISAMLCLLEISPLASSVLWAAQGIIVKVPDPAGTYCHLRFPAIREDTLFSDRPELKDPSEGDIIDLHVPCEYDPLGRDAILHQRADLQRERRRSYGSD